MSFESCNVVHRKLSYNDKNAENEVKDAVVDNQSKELKTKDKIVRRKQNNKQRESMKEAFRAESKDMKGQQVFNQLQAVLKKARKKTEAGIEGGERGAGGAKQGSDSSGRGGKSGKKLRGAKD